MCKKKTNLDNGISLINVHTNQTPLSQTFRFTRETIVDE